MQKLQSCHHVSALNHLTLLYEAVNIAEMNIRKLQHVDTVGKATAKTSSLQMVWHNTTAWCHCHRSDTPLQKA